MNRFSQATLLGLLTFSPLWAQANSTDPVDLMNNCERIASGRLGVAIDDVRVELQTARVDGSIPVNGFVLGFEGQDFTFQCNFDSKGMPGEFWNSKDIVGCPGDLSEADRWLFPGC
ncbi:hypothetical protein [uncultured Shimia sp.]|uniref:hypothetical protein n=1 Tax=uncultured Shimia sp. TaxID=573152 RepID=UPI002618F55A|nr:hypothetical protein [uncultured Shimia sp.]